MRYEQFYFVTLTKSRIVDHNDFYEQLKALVPPGTTVYGGQVSLEVGLCETGVVHYHVFLGFPFVHPRDRGRSGSRKWFTETSVRESLLEVFGERKEDLDPEKEDEECSDDDDDDPAEKAAEKAEAEVRYRAHVIVSGPLRGCRGEYRELSKFFENAQACVEKDDNKLLFGDRIDPGTVGAVLLTKVSVLGWTHVIVMC